MLGRKITFAEEKKQVLNLLLQHTPISRDVCGLLQNYACVESGKLLRRWDTGYNFKHYDWTTDETVFTFHPIRRLVFVTNEKESHMMIFDYNGNFVRNWDHRFFEFVFHIGVHAVADLIFVQTRDCIKVFNIDGLFIREWNVETKLISGLAIDSIRNLVYIIDGLNCCVLVFGIDGNFIRQWGSKGNGNGQLDHPRCIAVDEVRDLLFVGEFGNKRISVFHSDGSFVRHFCYDFVAKSITIHPTFERIYIVDFERERVYIFGSDYMEIGFCDVNRPTTIMVDTVRNTLLISSIIEWGCKGRRVNRYLVAVHEA